MTIEKLVDEIFALEYDEVKNKTLEDIISILYSNKVERLYVTKESYPIYCLDNFKILKIIFENQLKIKFKDFFENLKDYKLLVLDYRENVIKTFNLLRKLRVDSAPVVKDNRLIGAINFNNLSLKISYLAIKDELTHLFTEEYFELLVEEYKEIADEIGIIFIKVYNLELFENLYGIDFKNKVLIKVGDLIDSSVRDVDFVFRNDDIFKIITFSSVEVTLKIKNRIEERLSNLKVDNVEISSKAVLTHIPQLEKNILIAIERLEEDLIKWD